VVVLLGAPLAVQLRWDQWTTKLGITFFAGSVRGSCSHFFANLHSHTFTPWPTLRTVLPVEKQTMEFCSLEKALGADWQSTGKHCHKMYYQLAAASSYEAQEGSAPGPEHAEMLCAMATKMAELAGRSLEETATSAGICDYLVAGSLPQMAPVSAVAGGILAQELLKGVTQKGAPIGNFFFFSLADCRGICNMIGC